MAYVKKKKTEPTAKKLYLDSLILKCDAKRLPINMVKEFHRVNKSKKYRPLPEHLDPAIISMEIKDDKNQTLESLAVRIGAMYLWGYNDILTYLTENKDKLYYNEQDPCATLLYRKIKWEPGTNTDAYDLYKAL